MRVTGLSLEHYRCFDTVELAFDPGVTVIHGANGAGKTTLLESILFGLYGSRALSDATLADIITRGEEESDLSLSFVHEGGDYQLDREIVIQGERATTRQCVLHEPDGERFEGASDVRRRISSLLRMDAEAFVNSAYVKQGEINKLLHATPAERQSMIDELLQLGRLESYRDRADEARLAARALARERAERVDELETQRERLLDPDPYDRLNELESELEQLSEDIEEQQQRLDTLTDRRSELEQRREELAEQREELEELHEQRTELASSLEELDERRTDVSTELSELRTRSRELRDTLEDGLDALDLSAVEAVSEALTEVEASIESVEEELETHRSAIESARERAGEARERHAAIEDRLTEHRESLAELTEQLASDRDVLEERIEERDEALSELETVCESLPSEDTSRETLLAHKETVSDEIDQLEERTRALRDRKAALAEHIEQATSLAAEEKCPTCGQPVDDSPHIEQLEDDRETLADIEETLTDITDEIEEYEGQLDTIDDAIEVRNRIDRLDELVDEREGVVEERETRHDELSSTIEHAEDALADADDAVEAATDDIESTQESIADTNERLQELRDRRNELQSIQELQEEIEDIDNEIDRLEERREHLDELESDRRDQLADIDDRLETLEAAIDEAAEAPLVEELEEVTEEIETLKEGLTEAQTRRDELTEAIGSVRADINRLEEISDRLEDTTERQEVLDGLREEAVDLGQLYESVRAELRERNVSTLERLLNETFELLYRNDAYDRIDLSHDYELSVHSKDGEELDPAQLSGGERAIFNLSLRCAIYRLLAEGVEGAAPMPPLMLDEPTVFLDQGHVGRLLRLLETMRDIGVEQTLVVSHHESLLDAAEHRIAVEKDSATNRSSVVELATARPP